MNVSKALLKWYNNNRRELPWRDTKDPYIIWLSEIILQQTRVEQGKPYFFRFVERFPTIKDLAQSTENEILKLWQGLGYYSRARNLHEAAKTVMKDHNGIFPSEYEAIRGLRGVGDYTAAAIASFAYNQPYAVVDGNVYRVLSRYFGENIPIDSTRGKTMFAKLASGLLDPKNPGLHNQAMMELGALVCKPVNPECINCPLRTGCVAFAKNLVSELPVKSKKIKVRGRYFNYLLIRYKERIFLSQRRQSDIWSKLFEFPLIETSKSISHRKIMETAVWQLYVGVQQFHLKSVKDYPVHKLSHQHIHTRLFEVELKSKPSELLVSTFIEIDESKVHSYPVSRLMESILSDYLTEYV